MGNVLALDIGVVFWRVCLFDSTNSLNVDRACLDEGYFHPASSSFSIEHGGTLHFLQFVDFPSFAQSHTFTLIMDFLQKFQGQQIDKGLIYEFVAVKKSRSRYFDLLQNRDVADKIMKLSVIRDFEKLQPLIATAAMGREVLACMSKVFNADHVRYLDQTPFVVRAIDFQNRIRNDCFYHYTNSGGVIQRVNLTAPLIFKEPLNKHFFSLKRDLYPYLLVNMRTGLEFTRVNGPNDFLAINFGLLGASSFVGILSLLNYGTNPVPAIREAMTGDSSVADMSVADIYGGAYGSLGLPGDLIASSFGKLKDASKEELAQLRRKDVTRSLVTMISTNAMLMSLQLAKKHGVDRVVWIGTHDEVQEYEYLCAERINLLFVKNSTFLTSLGLYLAHSDSCQYVFKDTSQVSDEERKTQAPDYGPEAFASDKDFFGLEKEGMNPFDNDEMRLRKPSISQKLETRAFCNPIECNNSTQKRP